MSAFEIEQKINELVDDYRVEVEKELHEYLVNMAKHYIKTGTSSEIIKVKLHEYLINFMNSNRSSWSGGYTMTNLLEQVKLRVALRLADDYIYIGKLSQNEFR